MNILMFGRGVIATQYGWALEQAGSKVEFYVRPGRAAEYGPSVELDILDGRKSSKGAPVNVSWPITMREEIPPDHSYDLIIVSVNHEQLGPVIKAVASWAGNATILMFNNIWDDMQNIIAPLPKEQVVWGFPGGGGGYAGKTLHAGFVKSIFLQSADTAASQKRHQQVAGLFEQAGFRLSIQKDMRSWYWDHFLLDAALGAQMFREGSYERMFRSRAAVKEAVLVMQEILPIIERRGGTPLASSKMMMRLPAGLIAFALYKVIGGDGLMGEIMRRMEASSHVSKDTQSRFPKDVLATARQLGMPLPRLEALEPYFASKTESE
ncbi:MAG: ketopantoate reductase [Oscillospiraceae bacterium]|jgi:2-dehydropantoate 2-reductase|nr:ketopantoate reductase [Oscillospiraceae bacterium]